MLVLAGTCDRTALLTDFMIAEKVSALGMILQNMRFGLHSSIMSISRSAFAVSIVLVIHLELRGNPVWNSQGLAIDCL